MSDAHARGRDDADGRRSSLDDFIAALTLRRALIAVVVAGLVILVLSIGVGFVAGNGHATTTHVETEVGATLTIEQPAGQGFEWEIASIFGTAVGTTLLALATGFLAIGTWKDVRASQSMVELTRAEQYERIRPVVIGGVAGTTITGAQAGRLYSVAVRVGLANVGGGPAVRVKVAVVWTGSAFVGEAGAIRADAKVIRALSAGEDHEVEIVMKGDMNASDFKVEDLHVVGSYRDRLTNPAGSIVDWTKATPGPYDSPPEIEPAVDVDDGEIHIF